LATQISFYHGTQSKAFVRKHKPRTLVLAPQETSFLGFRSFLASYKLQHLQP